jgi:peptide/nickel transport system substrate-binding protein
VPGRGRQGDGYHQLAIAYLWYANTTTGDLIPWLAEKVEYSDDYKTVRIFTRRGAYWNDGVEFTADDVVFTIQTALNTPQWTTNGFATTWVESVSAESKYVVLVKLKAPNPRFHYAFTSIIWGTNWYIVPKHVWEGKDPVTFKDYPPLSIGPYNLKDVDPAGNWVLWEREENWWATKLWGLKPSPKYCLWIYYGPEEKVALAAARHEMDTALLTTAEVGEIAIKGGAPYVWGWRKEAPYAWPYDSCVKVLEFNLARYPFNITDVRKALTFAMNMSNLALGFTGKFDGSIPTPSPLPIVGTPMAYELYYEPLKDELEKIGIDTKTWYWKYDPQEAERLLKNLGFKRDANGKWLLPSGEPWKIEIIGVPEWADISRLAVLYAEEWKKFGIDATATLIPGALWGTRATKGDFDVAPWWQACTLLWDLTPHINWWHSKYFFASAPANSWPNYTFPKKAELDSIIDEMENTPPTPENKDKIIELGRRAVLIQTEEFAFPAFFPIPFYVIQDSYAWYGWPTYPDNYYLDPVNWWGQFLFIVLKLYPSGRVPTKDALPRPGGTLPTVPTVPTEELSKLGEKVDALGTSLSGVQSDVTELKTLVSGLSAEVSSISGQTSMLTTIILVEGIVIILLAVALMMMRRK